jgi:hypothetical protein
MPFIVAKANLFLAQPRQPRWFYSQTGPFTPMDILPDLKKGFLLRYAMIDESLRWVPAPLSDLRFDGAIMRPSLIRMRA